MDIPTLSIVIPVHNEEGNVEPLLEEVLRTLGDLPGGVELVMVDDGSTDQTPARLERAAQRDARIRVAHFRRNLGQTAAMAAGFHLARGNAVVTLDGDLQNDPADVPALVALLKDWDVVCGVRSKRRDTWLKRISSRIANGFRNWATGDNIVDTGCTLKAYRREWLEGLGLYHGMHRFLPTLLKMRGARVTQVPVRHRPRVAGKTHYGTWRRLFKGLDDVWAVRWMQRNHIDYRSVLEGAEEPESRDASQKHA
ncbi:MAG TPA: glycosyltransferase family 2 protein [Terriglobia bacterium]|nr:glycosyltransferase family 2 protein [Terriglobia bacterium]